MLGLGLGAAAALSPVSPTCDVTRGGVALLLKPVTPADFFCVDSVVT